MHLLSPPKARTLSRKVDECKPLLAGEGFNGVNPTFMLGRAIAAGRVLVGRGAHSARHVFTQITRLA